MAWRMSVSAWGPAVKWSHIFAPKGFWQEAVRHLLVLRPFDWVCKIALEDLTKRQLRHRFKR